MFVWDNDAVYDAIAEKYRKGIAVSMRMTLDNILLHGKAFETVQSVPTPLVRVQDKLQLRCRATILRQGRGPVQGLRLQCFGHTGKGNTRVLREEHVLPDTSINDQRRIMDAMCNIVAVQEGCDYKLTKPHQVVTPKKIILRPERGRR